MNIEMTYSLDRLGLFRYTGKALLMLKREDFCQRAPAIGDVIFNALQTLVLDYPGTTFVVSVSIRTSLATAATSTSVRWKTEGSLFPIFFLLSFFTIGSLTGDVTTGGQSLRRQIA